MNFPSSQGVKQQNTPRSSGQGLKTVENLDPGREREYGKYGSDHPLLPTNHTMHAKNFSCDQLNHRDSNQNPQSGNITFIIVNETKGIILYTVEPLITDPPTSGQPLHNGH